MEWFLFVDGENAEWLLFIFKCKQDGGEKLKEKPVKWLLTRHKKKKTHKENGEIFVIREFK